MSWILHDPNDFNKNFALIISLLLAEELVCPLMPPFGLDTDDATHLKSFINPFPPTHPSAYYKLVHFDHLSIQCFTNISLFFCNVPQMP